MSTTKIYRIYHYMQLQKKLMNNQPSISDAPKEYGNTELLHPMLLPAWDMRVSIKLPALFSFIVMVFF